VSQDEIDVIEGRLATTAGTCAVMGTASTMACIAEALGMSLPGTAAIPAVHADRLRAAEASGTLAVRLIHQPIRPSQVITPKSVENALRVLLALGGSTNAIIHLTGRGWAGWAFPISLQRLNELSDTTPVLVNLKPTGDHYMEDFHAAGGMGALLRELRAPAAPGRPGRHGRDPGRAPGAEEGAWADPRIVRPAADPVEPVGGLVALFGSLAPGGAILKRSAADKALFEKEGRAVVFTSLEDLSQRVDDPALDIGPEDFMVLRGTPAPPAAAACPRRATCPFRKKLAQAGLKDMVRISDARMSGTAFGTIVLHVTPEAAAGGPLALVRTGDRIRLSVRERRIDLLVDEAELARRRAALPPPPPRPARGYQKLYADHVLQADQGCDFDFLQHAADR
jgi:dihydroxy-acid dehydratase